MMRDSKSLKCGFAAVLAIVVLFVFCLIPQTAFAGTAKPAKPVIKSCKVVKVNNIKVTWKKSKNASKYKVQYRLKTAKKYTTAKTIKANKKSYSYTISGLKYSKKYQVRIVAVKGSKKAYSKLKTVTTGKKPENRSDGDDDGNNDVSEGDNGDNDVSF